MPSESPRQTEQRLRRAHRLLTNLYKDSFVESPLYIPLKTALGIVTLAISPDSERRDKIRSGFPFEKIDFEGNLSDRVNSFLNMATAGCAEIEQQEKKTYVKYDPSIQ